MSSDEYLSDRFVNAIPETKEAFGIKTNNTLSIECPYCHSTNVNRIGTINRALSIKMTGIASGKIGKQWHCNNCKSNFKIHLQPSRLRYVPLILLPVLLNLSTDW